MTANKDAGSTPDPICQGCQRPPAEIDEYRDAAAEELISADEYVRKEEGTYNPDNGHFLCTVCYLKAGMPASPQGWTCP